MEDVHCRIWHTKRVAPEVRPYNNLGGAKSLRKLRLIGWQCRCGA